uniref:Integrase catalytic domain-containing protein n=1 Tax=Tanacetum cinerariifolium TaxID=118510 RepID=A0A6L2KKC4_TANCI|nr:hypothetical protein [Tanacetum cinerariifolium]
MVKEKHDELIKQSLLTKSHYEGLVKQRTKVITDLKLKEEHDIDKMLSLEKQLKFLDEIVYKRSQSIQTIHMMGPKVPTYSGRPTFANPRYLKQAQSEIPCLYALPYDQSTHANRLILDREETLALERESRSKLNKDSDMEILIQTCLMPLDLKTQNDSFIFVHELKKEMHADLKYVESLEKQLDELKSDKAKFSNMYDMILQESRQAVSNTNLLKPGMYRIDNRTTKTRAPQSSQTVRNTNPHVSTSTGVNHKTNVSRPHHRSNQLKDKVVPNNSQVKLKKTQVEEHPRIPNISNKIKSVTACNNNLNSRTSNVNVVCATCEKCLVDSNHFSCVTKMLNDVNARTKKPNIVPITTRKPKGHTNKSVATPHKKRLHQNPQLRNQRVTIGCYMRKVIVQLILFIVDSGYTKHMTGNLKLLCNLVEKFLGTDRFGNDQFIPILGYGDLVQGIIMINRVYYIEGLNHNLFSVGQFCDADLKVAFRKSTCFVRDLQASPTQAWLRHRRLSHLNFNYINLLSKKDVVICLPKLKFIKDQLCSSCEVSKAKRISFKSKVVPSSKGKLNLLYMDLCGPMRDASINGKKYILVIVDEYSRYTWNLFLHSKDETPEVLKESLTMIQRNLQALVITVRTDRGTKFLNNTLNAFFKEEGIEHQTSTARTPEQNGVVER